MLCLGIESSCDETALALVEDGRLLASVLASQADVHALFGGVVPELASREHYRYIGPLFDELMRRCRRQAVDIDLVSVARGPGLLGSLLVGVPRAWLWDWGRASWASTICTRICWQWGWSGSCVFPV